MLSLLYLPFFFKVRKLSVVEKARKASHALHRSPGWQGMKNGQEVVESGEWKFFYRHVFSVDKVSISCPGLTIQ